jgi:hypothetical protein
VLTVGLALALSAAGAQAKPSGPVAHAAGSGAAAIDPPIVGVPITRTDKTLGNAADAIDAVDGQGAANALTASRRYLIRSYNGAKYLIANAPPAPAEAGSANARKFVTLARRAIRAARSRAAGHGGMHLPGAIHIPLKELDADTARQLDPGRAVVVYCWDAL